MEEETICLTEAEMEAVLDALDYYMAEPPTGPKVEQFLQSIRKKFEIALKTNPSIRKRTEPPAESRSKPK